MTRCNTLPRSAFCLRVRSLFAHSNSAAVFSERFSNLSKDGASGLSRGQEALAQLSDRGGNALGVVRAQLDQLAIHAYAFLRHVRSDEGIGLRCDLGQLRERKEFLTEFVKMLDILVHLAGAGLEVQAAKLIPISGLVHVQLLIADFAQARDIGRGTPSRDRPELLPGDRAIGRD